MRKTYYEVTGKQLLYNMGGTRPFCLTFSALSDAMDAITKIQKFIREQDRSILTDSEIGVSSEEERFLGKSAKFVCFWELDKLRIITEEKISV